jgi:ribonuclease J
VSKQELVFVPLGGVGEVGMNLSLYGIGPAPEKWLMVDCGVTFADESVPGVDLLMPDIRFALKHKKNIVGLAITHAHEDHIGAVLDLWPQLDCPIIATPFTAGLLAAKAEGEQGAPRIKVRIVKPGARIELGPFDVEFIPVAHSIPEATALAIRTKAGNVLHTGDWKIDPTPPLGDRVDFDRMAAFGAEGVDALVGDSTNAVREGRSPSEADVGKALTELIGKARGRVAVTLFSSNIGRVESIARAAEANGRSVVLIGRALQRAVMVAREVGYLSGVAPFLDMESFADLPRANVVAIMTGSQGEPRSALARVADGSHPHVSLSKGDTVVFSSRTIPGNERAVGSIMNGLTRMGAEIITDRTHLVHVSGHPRVDELKELYAVVKPRAVIPVHGEAVHLAAHAAVARSLGIATTTEVLNGAVVRLAPGPIEIVDWVATGRLAKDGRLLLDDEDRTIPERRKLARSGIISIAVAIGSKGDMLGEPDVEIMGVPRTGLSGKSILDVVLDTVEGVFSGLPRARRRDRDLVSNAIARAVGSAVDQEWGKRPFCHVLVVGE